MRKSYYTNGYTNDHDPTYYRDSYEQARRPRRVCRHVPDTGGRDDMARLGSAGRVWAGHGWLGVAWLGVAWQGRQGLAGRDTAWLGMARQAGLGRAGLGMARHGKAGRARRGTAWLGAAGLGMAGMARGKKSVPVTTTPGPTNKHNSQGA